MFLLAMIQITIFRSARAIIAAIERASLNGRASPDRSSADPE
ncbi:MAG: hypothetical protein ACRD9W_14370 [Terriglobia bacterium]